MFGFLRPKNIEINNYYNSEQHNLTVSKNEKGDKCFSIDGHVIKSVKSIKYLYKVEVEIDNGETINWSESSNPLHFTYMCKINNNEFQKIKHLLED